MKVLDLFCGAGGAAMGLHYALEKARIQHEITGVDIVYQKHYPFHFIQADALTFPLEGYDFIWASPPCQAYSMALYCNTDHEIRRLEHPKLIGVIRERLLTTRKPFIIENVCGASKDMINPIKLDGTQFNKTFVKRRLFELNKFDILLNNTPLNVRGKIKTGEYVGLVHHSQYPQERVEAKDLREAYEIDWVKDRKTLRQMIPPCYSEYLMEQFLKVRTDCGDTK